MERWARINFQPSIPLGENGLRATACKAHIDLSRKAAAEGMVLLKNENQTLPLKKGQKIAIFGRGQYDYIKGGGGSGVVATDYFRNIVDGLRIKASEGKVKIFEELSRFYEDTLREEVTFLNGLDRKVYAQHRLIQGIGSTEPMPSADLVKKAAAFTDTAIITISRYSCEKYERNSAVDGGDFYLSQQEQAMVETVKANFKNIIVVINAGAIVDVSWFCDCDKIDSALMAWQSGIEGGLAIADVLCGDVCPSGKLTDTIARAYLDYPSAATFMESDDYVDYYEDIYVGYRYFETIPGAKEKVVYPFGYGLSYTSFEISGVKVSEKNMTFTVTASVKNTGSVSGREVFQVYASAPQGILGKPARELVGFQKTKLLAPGESETVTVTFALSQIASYDDLGKVQKSAFLLENGTYTVYAGTSVRNAEAVYGYELGETKIVFQTVTRGAPQALKHRMKADGTMEDLPSVKPAAQDPLPAEIPHWESEKPVDLLSVAEGKITLDQFIGQMSDKELGEMLYGHPAVSVSPTNGFGGGGRKSKYCIPLLTTGDGPAGLRIPPEIGIGTTAFPCAFNLACTWDLELIEQVDAAIALEVQENNVAVYLAPALNIHRDPACGRNYEYYSEDPFLSGKLAAAAVRGIQSRGVVATVKHFACNGKETNRRQSDSRLSERALREIYLRGFELVCKEAKPWALMTAYNLVNGVRASQQNDLITGILRSEWGWDGLIMTDWHVLGGQVEEIMAGNDVKMPENLKLPDNEWYDLGQLITDGVLPRAYAQASVKRVLQLILRLA